MPGDTLAQQHCPECNGHLTTTTDCYTGHADHLDNFDTVESHLRDNGVISNDEYDFYKDSFSRTEYETAIESTDHTPRNGPFIIDSIVCTETTCNDCSYSRRTYTPPEQVTANIADALTA